jgi:hypothetical protein
VLLTLAARTPDRFGTLVVGDASSIWTARR